MSAPVSIRSKISVFSPISKCAGTGHIRFWTKSFDITYMQNWLGVSWSLADCSIVSALPYERGRGEVSKNTLYSFQPLFKNMSGSNTKRNTMSREQRQNNQLSYELSLSTLIMQETQNSKFNSVFEHNISELKTMFSLLMQE